jgi:hypothetical protein
VALKVNRVAVESHAAKDELTHGRRTLAGWPSVSALEMMLDVYDFEIEHRYDWEAVLRDRPNIAPNAGAYTTGNRVTWRCRLRAGD